VLFEFPYLKNTMVKENQKIKIQYGPNPEGLQKA
jgi:hypothetical protein